MEKNKSFEPRLITRLTGYSLSAGALALVGGSAYGQVVYSGLQNLDFYMPESHQEVDMNNDGVIDFEFFFAGENSTYSSGSYFRRMDQMYAFILNPRSNVYNSWMYKAGAISIFYSTFSQLISNTMAIPVASNLEEEAAIGSSASNWAQARVASAYGILGLAQSASMYDSASHWMYMDARAGSFLGKTQFLGVRFYFGGELHYGWIRVSLGDHVTPFKVLDWAYESVPDVPILAGEGGDLAGPVVSFLGTEETTPHPKTTLIVKFDEPAEGLELGDFSVSNGAASNLRVVTEGLVYTVDIISESFGDVELSLHQAAVEDVFGAPNDEAGVSWVYVDALVALDNQRGDELRIFPNPASEFVRVELEEASDILLTDMNGRELMKERNVLSAGLDISGIQPGAYVIMIKNSRWVKQRTLIVHE
ncbi:MAG: T9SS type A sorting domain-containing protein [Bacteroidales bacterium]|nr:T9SS type A sorting domain-containing protein [Bacteroidales bacterium]